MVHYQGTRFHPRLGTDHQLLPALDFLALLVPHIALRYEILSRSYGAASTTFRKKAGWIRNPPVRRPPPQAKPSSLVGPEGAGENDPLPPPPPSDSKPAVSRPPADEPEDPFTRERRRNWARLIARTWLHDPETCPRCGTRMEVLAAISSPEQDGVIEKILRSRGEWDPPWKRSRKVRGRDPPWKRSRKVRGPPPSTPTSRDRGRDHPPEDWSEAVDPPHPEDHPDPPIEDGWEG